MVFVRVCLIGRECSGIPGRLARIIHEQAIFTSPEFFSADAYHAKIKTPLEVVASSVRALGGEIASPSGASGPTAGGAFGLARQVANLGEPLYEAQPPAGHADVAEAWVNTDALVARMNFALALAHNRIPDVRVDFDKMLPDAHHRQPDEVLAGLVTRVLHGEMAPETQRALAAQLDTFESRRAPVDEHGAGNANVEKLLALVLGSPEFQRK